MPNRKFYVSTASVAVNFPGMVLAGIFLCMTRAMRFVLTAHAVNFFNKVLVAAAAMGRMPRIAHFAREMVSR